MSRPKRSRLRAFLSSRWLPVFAAAAGILLMSPSLWLGLHSDDYIHRLSLTKPKGLESWHRSPDRLFAFLDGDPAQIRQFMNYGALPWFTAPDLKLNFYRPVAGYSHWLDYQLWPDTPTLMHVQSLLWYAALVGVMALLYRRWHGAGMVGGLAILLYALDDGRGMPAVWLANRNAMIAGVFGGLCLYFHDRWRRDGWSGGSWLSPLMLALALGGNEGAVATGGYLLAYALFVDRGRWLQRIGSLLPCGLLGVAYVLCYKAAGYGSHGSGMYLDPLSDGLDFGRAILVRGPQLICGLFLQPQASFFMVLGEAAARTLEAIGVLLLLVFGLLLIPVFRRDRLARFYAVGTLLALVPCCATFPSDRLFTLASIGAMGLLAVFVRYAWSSGSMRTAEGLVGGTADDRQPGVARVDACPPRAPTLSLFYRIPARALTLLLLLFALLMSPLGLLQETANTKRFGGMFTRLAMSLPDEPALAGRQLMVLSTPSSFFPLSIPSIRLVNGRVLPARMLVLGSGIHGTTVTREDDRTLLIRQEDGFLSPHAVIKPDDPQIAVRYVVRIFDPLFRNPAQAFTAGETIPLDGVRVEVVSLTADGRPLEVRFRFDIPLDDPRFLWVRWKQAEFVGINLPAAGGRLSFPPPRLPMMESPPTDDVREEAARGR